VREGAVHESCSVFIDSSRMYNAGVALDAADFVLEHVQYRMDAGVTVPHRQQQPQQPSLMTHFTLPFVAGWVSGERARVSAPRT